MSKMIHEKPTRRALLAWEHNLQIALLRWSQVLPERVLPALEVWRCGTQACFGGHLATWPEFQAIGIQVDQRDGAPYYSVKDVEFLEGINKALGGVHNAYGSQLTGSRLSVLLFGYVGMFHPRLDGEEGDAHEIVRLRLEQRLNAVRLQLMELRLPIGRKRDSLFMSPR